MRTAMTLSLATLPVFAIAVVYAQHAPPVLVAPAPDPVLAPAYIQPSLVRPTRSRNTRPAHVATPVRPALPSRRLTPRRVPPARSRAPPAPSPRCAIT